MNNRFKYLLSALGGLLLLAVIVVPIGLYISNMGKGLSSVSENWGDFGSYLGGTISSITGSFSLLIIAISLVMQINDRRRDVYAKNLESRIKYIDALIQRTDDNLKYFESEMNLKRDISMLNSSKKTTEVDKNKDAGLLHLKLELLEKNKNRDEIVTHYSSVKQDLYVLSGYNQKELDSTFYDGVSEGLDLSMEYKI